MRCGIALALCWALVGCAVFSGKEIPRVAFLHERLPEAARPSLAYRFSAKTAIGKRGGPQWTDKERRQLEEEFSVTVAGSGLVKSVVRSGRHSDIGVRLTMVSKVSQAAVAGLNLGWELRYILPTWARERYEVTAVVGHRNGLQRTYTLTDSAVIVHWIPMLFLYPFNSERVFSKVRMNLYRKLLLEIHADGFFQRVPTG